MVLNKIFVVSTLLLSLTFAFKYNKKCKKSTKSNIDKTTSVTNLIDSSLNNIECQTVISLDKNDTFLIKEININSENKWYDIIEKVEHL